MFRGKLLHVVTLLVAIGVSLTLASSTVAASSPNGITRPIEGDTIGGEVTVQAVADDPNFAAWQLDLLPMSSDKPGYFISRGDKPHPVAGVLERMNVDAFPNGLYRLRLRVIKRDGNYDEYFTTFTINNSGAAQDNGFTSPTNGSKVMCLTELKGYANGTDFRKWQVDLLPNGIESAAVFLGRGFAPQPLEKSFGLYDFSQFQDGEHVLRLRVVKGDGNYSEFNSRIVVDNSLFAPALSKRTCSCANSELATTPAGPNGIMNPPSGTGISKNVPICGIADDPTFASWTLDLLFDGDERTAVPIAHGTTPNRVGAPFTVFDTTALPDGFYGLRLSVSKVDYTTVSHTSFVCVENRVPVPAGQTSACRSNPRFKPKSP